jgi:hypothetical protein
MSPPFRRSHLAVYKGPSCCPGRGSWRPARPLPLEAGPVTAQSLRSHQLLCGAAGIGDIEDGDSNGACRQEREAAEVRETALRSPAASILSLTTC